MDFRTFSSIFLRLPPSLSPSLPCPSTLPSQFATEGDTFTDFTLFEEDMSPEIPQPISIQVLRGGLQAARGTLVQLHSKELVNRKLVLAVRRTEKSGGGLALRDVWVRKVTETSLHFMDV